MKKERIPTALRRMVIERDGYYCVYCDENLENSEIHLDHVIPESKGGTLTIDNLKPICARCNLSMGDNYTISEWQNFKRKADDVKPKADDVKPKADDVKPKAESKKDNNDDKSNEKIIPPKYRNKKCFNCF